ncbi:MAG: bifunctional 2-C-methyl-D-erythritol 4-phosphate cytidylyltransferase/2-C-methyl-D-erythritol 2,4-cyclodiphosphate synthase [Alphaproteobacteria bacterium]|nr:bifunctional 2-C-methyl-D-erythritol 4-phosphate cytidylyltransferase/2-C-methyl-D-erythritol 2,4-cyclodiphosphate synthase [Alphaproteobacteria bacterium]
MARIAAILVAAGDGVRAGPGPPKQYRPLMGEPILRHSIERFAGAPLVSKLQVVIREAHTALCSQAAADFDLPPAIVGGTTRQCSVRRGLAAIEDVNPDFVLIHDAARPLVSPALIEVVIAKLIAGAEAVVPLLPVTDSLRRISSGEVGEAVPREGLCRAQTPQGFDYKKIRSAHERFAGANATDDIALAERAGMRIAAVPGEEANIKVTAPGDFAFAERLLAGASEVRTGNGFDVHRFRAGDHVWLCGVPIPHDRGLEGHSDADAGLHALTDAMLGALAAGDIGQHFPPSEERWRGAASRVFLQHAAELVKQRGGAILHCDITIICEWPKIGPHREAMRVSVAEVLGIDISRVSVKATTTEGLGFTGRGEGLAAQAVATIRLPA